MHKQILSMSIFLSHKLLVVHPTRLGLSYLSQQTQSLTEMQLQKPLVPLRDVAPDASFAPVSLQIRAATPVFVKPNCTSFKLTTLKHLKKAVRKAIYSCCLTQLRG